MEGAKEVCFPSKTPDLAGLIRRVGGGGVGVQFPVFSVFASCLSQGTISARGSSHGPQERADIVPRPVVQPRSIWRVDMSRFSAGTRPPQTEEIKMWKSFPEQRSESMTFMLQDISRIKWRGRGGMCCGHKKLLYGHTGPTGLCSGPPV